MARANAVRDFLVKYGAAPAQIEATSEGKANPRYPGQKDVYQKTDEARYMNRRVSLTVFDAGGKQVSAGGAAEAIRAIPPAAAGVTDCCSEVLKKPGQTGRHRQDAEGSGRPERRLEGSNWTL